VIGPIPARLSDLVKALPTLPDDHPRNNGTRLGWRWTARGVIDQIITDFRVAG
jgi:hypothetical protein